jgi:hypothetical protein
MWELVGGGVEGCGQKERVKGAECDRRASNAYMKVE